MISTTSDVRVDSGEIDACLKMLNEAIRGVIDIAQAEASEERPADAMDVLTKIRYVQMQLSDARQASRRAEKQRREHLDG